MEGEKLRRWGKSRRRPSTSSGESKGEMKVLRTRSRPLDYAAASLRDEVSG
jgi:hypothetical protein